MSIHPSLSSSEKDRKQRSVLKRTERLKMMQEKNKWKEGDSVFGLPKIKTVRIKIKKEKAAEKPEEAVATEGAPAAAAGSLTAKEQPAAKTAASAKAPASKEKDKEKK